MVSTYNCGPRFRARRSCPVCSTAPATTWPTYCGLSYHQVTQQRHQTYIFSYYQVMEAVDCLLSLVLCLLSHARPLSQASCLPPHISCLTSHVSRFLIHVSCLTCPTLLNCFKQNQNTVLYTVQCTFTGSTISLSVSFSLLK